MWLQCQMQIKRALHVEENRAEILVRRIFKNPKIIKHTLCARHGISWVHVDSSLMGLMMG